MNHYKTVPILQVVLIKNRSDAIKVNALDQSVRKRFTCILTGDRTRWVALNPIGKSIYHDGKHVTQFSMRAIYIYISHG